MQLHPPPVKVEAPKVASVTASALRKLFAEQRQRALRKKVSAISARYPTVRNGTGDDIEDDSVVGSTEGARHSSESESSGVADDENAPIDRWLARQKRHGAHENNFVHERILCTRLYKSLKSGVKVLSGYSVHCSHGDDHIDLDRPHLECKKDLHMGE